MAKIYVASSWRNPYFADVVSLLRSAGHEVYDFRNPPHGGHGFQWAEIAPDMGVGAAGCAVGAATEWTFDQYRQGLKHPKAERQFAADLEAMQWADTCVLVLPCGRSAHTEAGWFSGRGLKTIAYIPQFDEPELMYKLFDAIVATPTELLEALK